MVKLSVRKSEGESPTEPDIFHAALHDDPLEMAAAIQHGQTLDDVSADGSNMTPMHIACINKSSKFLNAALTHDFDPWKRDVNERLPIDHARAQGMKNVQEKLYGMMYPSTDFSVDVIDFPTL